MFVDSENFNLFLNSYCFTAENFKTDTFVIDIRKYNDPKAVLKELKGYHETLCYQIMQHMNEEYIDYIILSTNIAGTDKHIKSITSSLEEMKFAVSEEKDILSKELSSVNDIILKKSSIKKNKMLINCFILMFKTLEEIENLDNRCLKENESLILIERMALALNPFQFLYREVFVLKYFQHDKDKFQNIVWKVECYLETQLLYSINEGDVNNFADVLHIYSILDKKDEVETIFRQQYVKSFIQKHVTYENMAQFGLWKVYDYVTSFISQFCSIVLSLKSTETWAEQVPWYDFIINAVWTEILQQISYVLPSTTYTPADAQKFHEDYSATLAFLQQLEKYFGMITSVKVMRQQSIYQEFVKQWNLEAYFKIRFIEIAGSFERTLLSQCRNKDTIVRNDTAYILSPSKSLIECLNYCWKDEVFILPLRHEFWKFTLLLISRYNTWVISYIKGNESEHVLIYQMAVAVLRDIEQLLMDFEKIFNKKICSKIDKKLVEMAFLDLINLLKRTALFAEKSTIDLLLKKCCAHITAVGDIPKLYLKTNREVPNKPSTYVSSICDSLREFSSNTDSIISKEIKKSIMKCIANVIIDEWSAAVYGVIMSIKKMEESLQLLKRMKNKSYKEVKANDKTDDDEKIKMQLMLDAECIEKCFEQIKIENIEKLKNLKDFVTLF